MTDDRIELTVTDSYRTRWDHHGRCFERVNNGPEARRPDLDFGTPMGNLLIDPWLQNAIRDKRRSE